MAAIDEIGLSKLPLDGVYLDDYYGVAGTDWPIGTPGMPVDNLTDAISIAVARGLNIFYLVSGSFSIPSNIDAYHFIGIDEENSILSLNGKVLDRCSFNGLQVSGIAASGSLCFFKNCRLINDLTLYGAHDFEDTVAWDGTKIKVGEDWTQILFDKSSCFQDNTIDFNDLIAKILLIDSSGNVTIAKMSDASSELRVYGNGLCLTLGPTCTAGDIYIYGDVKIIDNSSGVTINDYTNKPKAEEAVSINAINASETNFLNLAAAGFHYTIDDLVLKCADPGANTVNVKLYKLVNGVLTNTQTFAITTVNFATYFDINSMFGLKSLAGDNIKITVQATAGGPYAVTGSYAYRSA